MAIGNGMFAPGADDESNPKYLPTTHPARYRDNGYLDHGITDAEIRSRGRQRALIEDALVFTAIDRVDRSGIPASLEQWRFEDATNREGVGGRPSIVPERALLVGLLLLAGERNALFMRTLSELLQYRLSPTAQRRLGLPAEPHAFGQARASRKRWENNTYNAFHRMLALMDPYPLNRGLSRTWSEVQDILGSHDPVRAAAMKERLDQFTRGFLAMTFHIQPRHVRRATKSIHISVDQTYIKPPTKKGFSKKNLSKKVAEEQRAIAEGRALQAGPVDPFAGWYAKTGERPDLAPGTQDTTGPNARGANSTELVWGWTVNIGVRVDAENPSSQRFPSIAIAATLSMPNVGTSEEAVTLMRHALDTGLPAGVADGDKAYWANALEERLHLPTRELGFMPSTEYRVDRLGPRGGAHGAQYIEGERYCPGMPSALKTATQDQLQGRIDESTFRVRIEERMPFALHVKELEDDKGRIVLTCPARGISPTVTCPLVEMAKKAADKQRPGVAEADVPDFLDKICKQHSVSFAANDNIRQEQAFRYGSTEWEQFHEHARQSIESLNSGVKNPAEEQLEESGRRRVRGFAAAAVFVTILLTNYNLRKVAAFLHDAELEKSEPTKRPPAGPHRPRRRDREFYNPYTKTTPPGLLPPEYAEEKVAAKIAERAKREKNTDGALPTRT